MIEILLTFWIELYEVFKEISVITYAFLIID